MSIDKEEKMFIELLSFFKEYPFSLCVVFNNLHLGDEFTIKFLKYYLTQINSGIDKKSIRYKTIFLCTIRNDINQNKLISELFDTKNNDYVYCIKELEPLNKDALMKLIKEKGYHPISKESLNQIYLMTGGNPFSIELLLENLRQEKMLIEENNEWKIKKEYDNVILNHLIEDKLQRFINSPSTELILSICTIIGQKTNKYLLEMICDEMDMNEKDLGDSLETLDENNILMYKDPEYIFYHNLYREALLNRIKTIKEKTKLFRKIAEVSINFYGNNIKNYYSTIAYYYEQADKYSDNIKAMNYYYKAGVEIKRKNIPEAQEYFQKVISINNKLGGDKASDNILIDCKTHQLIFNVYNLCEVEDYNSALEECERVLKIKSDDDLAYDWKGFIYYKLKNPEETIKAYEMALTLRVNMFGESNPIVAEAYTNLGKAYKFSGNFDRSMEYHQKALDINYSCLEENPLAISASYGGIASIYRSKGQYDKALEYYNKALILTREKLGENHIETAYLYNNIALVEVEEKKNLNQIISTYSKVIKILKKSLCKNHTLIGTLYNNIGKLYLVRGKTNKAVFYFEKSISITENVLGEDHHDTAVLYNNIGMAFYKMNLYDKAKSYLEKSLKILKSILGENHFLVGTTYNNLGLVFKSIGEFNKAEIYLSNKALPILKSTIGDKHPYIIKLLISIGDTYKAWNKIDKSIKYYEDGLTLANTIYEKDNTYFGKVYRKLGDVYALIPDKQKQAKSFYENAIQFIKNKSESEEIIELIEGLNIPDNS